MLRRLYPAAVALLMTMAVELSAQAPSAHVGLRIVVVEGEEAVNIIEQKTATAPVIEVRDRNNQAVAGAVVRFAVTRGRASFDGARTLSVVTNAAGRATASGLTPTGAGAVQISASATVQGQTVAATIAQTNVMTLAEASAEASAAGSYRRARAPRVRAPAVRPVPPGEGRAAACPPPHSASSAPRRLVVLSRQEKFSLRTFQSTSDRCRARWSRRRQRRRGSRCRARRPRSWTTCSRSASKPRPLPWMASRRRGEHRPGQRLPAMVPSQLLRAAASRGRSAGCRRASRFRSCNPEPFNPGTWSNTITFVGALSGNVVTGTVTIVYTADFPNNVSFGRWDFPVTLTRK